MDRIDSPLADVLFPDLPWLDRRVRAVMPTRTAAATFHGDTGAAMRLLAERGRVIGDSSPSEVHVVLDARTFAGRRAYDQDQPMLVAAAVTEETPGVVELSAAAKGAWIDRGGLARRLDSVVSVLEAETTQDSGLSPTHELERHPVTADEAVSIRRGERGNVLRTVWILFMLAGLALWFFGPSAANGWTIVGILVALNVAWLVAAFWIGRAARTRYRREPTG